MTTPQERLSELGYFFNENNELRLLNNKTQPVEMTDISNPVYLNEIILDYVQQQMIEQYQLKEVWVPFSKKQSIEKNERNTRKFQSNIFLSQNWNTSKKLLLIICGSGMVRAGQWSTSLCITKNLDSGAIFPYLKQAQEEGYGIMIVNPNNIRSTRVRKKDQFEKNAKTRPEMNKQSIKTTTKIVLEEFEEQGMELIYQIQLKMPELTILELFYSVLKSIVKNYKNKNQTNLNDSLRKDMNEYALLWDRVTLSELSQYHFLNEIKKLLQKNEQYSHYFEIFLKNFLFFSIISFPVMKNYIKDYNKKLNKIEINTEKLISYINEQEKKSTILVKKKLISEDVWIDHGEVPENNSPTKHMEYIWKTFITKTKASIYIVAHSYGGYLTVTLLNTYKKNFQKRVAKIAFTDSVHSYNDDFFSKKQNKWFYEHAQNWVRSSKKLGVLVFKKNQGVKCVSAGHVEHKWTSATSISQVFEYLRN
ncbi:fam172 family protein [Anaeramoeba flamelloides]|uniref:Fam172 family protein n=1 Tax=Anaeramoeba flamelloides TaxID=1746091 RepID=A0AAV8AFX1_9EUKA|nr:fam172 family protein [Anaeramoeba flamelloides]